MQGRYVGVSKVRKQIGVFTDYLESINPQFNYIVDLSTHLQANEIQEDWFYDPVTGTFSAEGEIVYPEPTPPEPTPPSPTEEKLAALQAENETIMLALADIYEAQIVAVK